MEMTKYTVFYTSGFLTDGDCECHALEDYLSEEVVGSTPPVAWAPVGYWEWARDNPGRDCDDLRAESIAAGRTFEYIAGKYIPRGVPGEPEKKEQNQFRVGGVYRDSEGDIVRLCLAGDRVGAQFMCEDAWLLHGGFFSLQTGECEHHPLLRLLPGELEKNADGNWVPVGGCGVGLESATADEMTFEELTDDLLSRSASSCAKRDSDENHRPALTWDTKTRFDAFKGWEPVRSWVDFDELSNADHAYSDPLQKLGDTSNPLHGSAHFANKG